MTKKLRISLLCILLGMAVLLGAVAFPLSENTETAVADGIETPSYTYLSDVTPYSASIGYDALKKDCGLNGGLLSLIVGGERKYFYTGIFAHATSTLIYDLGAEHGYDWFSGYFGVDAVQEGKGNVKFSVYVSDDVDGYWTTVLQPTVRTSSDEALYVKVSVQGVRYLKFYFDSNGVNYNDHSCVCNPFLYIDGVDVESELESDALIKPVSYFDELFDGVGYSEIVKNHSLDLLRRALVDRVGYNVLKYNFLRGDEEPQRREMLTWLWNNEDALRDFITGGEPNHGNYVNSLTVLTKLYQAHEEDLSDGTALFEPEAGSARKRGDLYRTMMISIALTHDVGPYLWMDSRVASNPLERYEALKKTYLDPTYHLRNDIFENLNVEEMRYIMSSRISNDEIYWLNAYVRNNPKGQTDFPGLYSPHRYLRYGKDWDYAKKGYLTESNFEQYNTKYSLEEYGLGFTTSPRIWMIFEGSHICWGISYTGSCFATAFGVPSHYVRQEDHAAFFMYNKNADGRTVWGIDNNIYGWTVTWLAEDVVGNGNNRMMCGWGTKGNGWSTWSNATYILLAATALDNQEAYERAEMYMTLASLAKDKGEQESLYRAALEAQPYHLDAWYELVKYYIANKSAKEMAALAEEIAEEMYYFPLPMTDLITLLKTAVKNSGDGDAATQLARLTSCHEEALLKGSAATSDEQAKALLAQPDVCATEANYLLGRFSDKLASFSFNGDNAGKIVFGGSYSGVRYRYSLDGGKTWSVTDYTTSSNMAKQLTAAELSSITAENDLLIWLEGWTSDNNNEPVADKAYRIDILAGTAVGGIESNDNENRFLGNLTDMEYSFDETEWFTLTDQTLFEGAKTVYVHKKANGVTMTGLTATYTFTDNNTDKRSYIPISRLTLVGYSSEESSQGDYAKNAIDGRLATRWHTLWNGNDTARYITVKADKPTYFSGFDYTGTGSNGTLVCCDVYVSMDGNSWTLAARSPNWSKNAVKKQLTFDPVYGQYIKVVAVNTWDKFFSARMLEFFEDTTFVGKETIGLKLVSSPNQTSYIVGEKFNSDGMTVDFVYKDNTSAHIPNSLLAVSTDLFTEEGTHTVYIGYGDFVPVTVTVTVTERTMVPTVLTVETLPEKTVLYQGDALSKNGMSVSISDGAKKCYLQSWEYTLTCATDTVGTAQAVVSYLSLNATFDITVKKGIVGLEILHAPDKTGYVLEEAFDATGMTAQLIFADASTQAAEYGVDYILLNSDFSALSGVCTLIFGVTDRQTVTASASTVVYPYFTDGCVRYEITVENDRDVCMVTGFICDGETFVTVPEKVAKGKKTYTVVGVESGAMEGVLSVKAVSLPGTVHLIAAESFTGCDCIEKIYMTGHTSFDGMTVEENAFDEETEIIFFASTESLTQELTNKDFVTEFMKVKEVTEEIVGVSVLPPTKTKYIRGESLNTDGLQLFALLDGGNKVPLAEGTYTVESVDLSTAGEKTVTVVLNKTGQSDTFSVTVENTTVKITAHPISAIYYSTEAQVAPLTVAGLSSDGSALLYQWYRSESGAIDEEADVLLGENASSCLPTKNGYYYASVRAEGTDSVAFSMVATVEIDDYVAVVNMHGYHTLNDAFAVASNNSVVELLKDTVLTAAVELSKTVTLDGNGFTVTRGSGFTTAFFTVSSGSLTLNDVTLDGSCVWTNDYYYETVKRGTCNSGITAYGPLIKMTGTGKLTVNNSVLHKNYNLSGNTENTTAGAIFATSQAAIVLNETVIENCYSFLFGSAVYLRGSSQMTVNGGTIRYNSGNSKYNTSAICADNNSVVTLNGGSVVNNLGYAKGGAFWISNGKVTVNGGTVENNASSLGAGFYLNGTGVLAFNNFEKTQEVYLPNGKFITVTGDLRGKTLPVKTEKTNSGTVVAKGTDEALLAKAVGALNVSGKLLTLSGLQIVLTDVSSAAVSINGKEYASFSDAVKAFSDTDTVLLLQDTELTSDVFIDKEITFDVGAFTLSGSGSLLPADGYGCIENGTEKTFYRIIYVESVALNHTEITVKTGDTTLLVASVFPVDATDTTVTWTSSDENVATVVGGLVTGVADGTTTVTVRTTDGNFSATCSVTVASHIHAYVSPQYVWTNDYSSCTARAECECGEYVEETVLALSSVLQYRDCVLDEIISYTVTFVSSSFSEQTVRSVPLTALGHDMTYTEPHAPDCIRDGNNAYYVCKHCNLLFKDETGITQTAAEAETLAALGHGSEGYTWITEGTLNRYCNRCHEITESKELIALTDYSVPTSQSEGAENCSLILLSGKLPEGATYTVSENNKDDVTTEGKKTKKYLSVQLRSADGIDLNDMLGNSYAVECVLPEELLADESLTLLQKTSDGWKEVNFDRTENGSVLFRTDSTGEFAFAVNDDAESGLSLTLILIVVGGALLVLVIVIVAVSASKKKKEAASAAKPVLPVSTASTDYSHYIK